MLNAYKLHTLKRKINNNGSLGICLIPIVNDFSQFSRLFDVDMMKYLCSIPNKSMCLFRWIRVFCLSAVFTWNCINNSSLSKTFIMHILFDSSLMAHDFPYISTFLSINSKKKTHTFNDWTRTISIVYCRLCVVLALLAHGSMSNENENRNAIALIWWFWMKTGTFSCVNRETIACIV